MGGLEKAFDKSGDSLLSDLAQIIRRASSNDQYVGDVFKAQVTEVRPPVDTVIAGYGVGYKDSDRRESRVMTTSTNSVLIGGAGPGAPMAPAVAVKPMSVDEKNRAIRARAVAEAKK